MASNDIGKLNLLLMSLRGQRQALDSVIGTIQNAVDLCDENEALKAELEGYRKDKIAYFDQCLAKSDDTVPESQPISFMGPDLQHILFPNSGEVESGNWVYEHGTLKIINSRPAGETL